MTAAAGSSVSTSSNASTALTNVKNAITKLAAYRADVGANMSRLEAESSTLSVLKDNISAAKAVLLMWTLPKKVPTLPVSRFWSNRELPCRTG